MRARKLPEADAPRHDPPVDVRDHRLVVGAVGAADLAAVGDRRERGIREEEARVAGLDRVLRVGRGRAVKLWKWVLDIPFMRLVPS